MPHTFGWLVEKAPPTMSSTVTVTVSTFTAASPTYENWAITATASARPEPPPIFTQNFYGLLSTLDALILLLGLWTALIIGFSRFSMFPILLPFCAALGNGLCVYAVYPHHHPDLRLPVILIAYVPWTIQNLGAPFYNYFILRTLLAGRETERKLFTILFNTLMACTLLVRIPQTYFMATNDNPRTNYIHFCLMKTYFSLLAATETLSAAFLLNTLKRAMRISRGHNNNSSGACKREGLLRQLARSSEVRLATLAGVGTLRAVAWGWTIQWPSDTTVALGFDDFAVITENVYPMLLIIDLFAARLKGGAMEKSSQKSKRDSRPRARWTAPPGLKGTCRLQNLDEEAAGRGSGRNLSREDTRSRKGSANRRFSKLMNRKMLDRGVGGNVDDQSAVTVHVASIDGSHVGSSNASHIASSANISVGHGGGDLERFRTGSYATV